MTHCLAPDCQMGGLGCDNMTVLLVCFLNGKSYEDLAARCARDLQCTVSSDLSLVSSSCSSSTPESQDDGFIQREGENLELNSNCHKIGQLMIDLSSQVDDALTLS